MDPDLMVFHKGNELNHDRRWEQELEIMVETKLKEFNALGSEKLDDLIPAF